MAGGSIADLFFRAMLDSRQLELDAVKAGDKAGQTMGGRMSSAIGTAMRVGLGVVSAGAAIATKGLIELDNTMAQFTADTGLAGEAADDAKKSILEMSGRNLQPMKEIGGVLGKVHTDLGLTGEAADETAEQFLHFSRITKRDASEEVAAFDDILDAWGLTAEDSGGIMDQLVKSHQTFGGSIADDEEALKNLAPAMKALNFGIDDSIGLLNLFKSKGLDAATSQRAFNTAVKNLPPGTKLEDVLEKIQAIEDPALRAAAATEIFGTKGGNALANALRPGIGSLDDFKVTQEDANGAMEAGREAIDGTFGNWAQLQLKGFTTKLTELGTSFGPAVTGLASLGTLAGSLGFKTLGSKLSAGVASAWKSVLSSTLVSGAVAKASSLAATAYLKALMFGDTISGAVSKAWGKVASATLVKNAIAKVSGLAATAYLKALIFGDAISTAISGMWTKIAGTGSVATKTAGLAGKAAGVAYRLGVLAGVATVGFIIGDVLFPKKDAETQAEQLGEDTAAALVSGQIAELQSQRDKLSKAMGDLLLPGFDPLRPIKTLLGETTLQEFESQIAEIDAQIARLGGAALTPLAEFGPKVGDLIRSGAPAIAAGAKDAFAPVGTAAEQAFRDLGYSADQARELVGSDARVLGGEVVGAFDVMVPSITDGAEAWEKYREDTKVAQDKAITDQLDFTSRALSDLIGFQSGVEDALSGVYNAETDATVTKNRITIINGEIAQLDKEQRKAKKEALAEGRTLTAAEIADYQNRRIALVGEAEELNLHLALIGDDMHRVTALNALLTAKDLKTNLLSENDNIRTAAQVQRDKIIGYLQDLATQGGPAAANAAKIVEQWLNPDNPLSPLFEVEGNAAEMGGDFADGISSKDEAARRAAMELTEPVKDQMKLPKAYTWGQNAAQEFADGVRSRASYLNAATAAYLLNMKEKLEADSPPGPKSPLHKIDVWGERTADAYADPLLARLKALVERARGHIADLGTSLSRPMGMGAITAPRMPAIAVAGAGALGRPAIPYLSPEGFGGGTGGPGGSVTNVNVQVPGLLRAETPADVVRTLRHLSVYGTFGEPRDKG